MHRGSIHQRHPKAPFKSKPCGFDCYTVLAPVSKCYPLLMGRLPTCYSPVRHSSFSGGASSGGKRSVRLACIRHAASVRPEPGSNSHFKVCDSLFLLANWLRKCFCFFIEALHICFIETLFSFQRSYIQIAWCDFYILSLDEYLSRTFLNKNPNHIHNFHLATTFISYQVVIYLSTTS